ncbi:MAG: FAD-binding oxidoreductase [Dehalococcoidia bacterium]|nr:FAD-binding oxidoreductase [Dehalococcoidia bacterium]MDW8120301.1 FAD-dependent oxidoreductase [Chloroflexota bacterium]
MPDIVVIGAGVAGASIAYYLAKAGAQVTLLERHQPGGYTTWASFGLINAARKRPEHYHRFSRMAIDAYGPLAEEVGEEVLIGTGVLHWPASLGGPAETERLAQELTRFGYPFQRLSPREAAELEPAVHPLHAEGPILFFPQERWTDADRLAQVLVRRAQGRGAQVHLGCAVHEIRTTNGRVEGVLTSAGFIAARQVVVAGGTASVGLLAPLGYRPPVERVIGVVIYTSPVPGLVRRAVYPGHYHIHPTHDGRLVLGAIPYDRLVSEETVSTPPPSWTHRLLGEAQRDIPALQGATVAELRIGVRPVPKDGLPIIGPVPGVEGAYVAVMHSAVTLAALVGQTVAQEVAQGRPSPLLEPYRPSRFPDALLR